MMLCTSYPRGAPKLTGSLLTERKGGRIVDTARQATGVAWLLLWQSKFHPPNDAACKTLLNFLTLS